MNSLWTIWIWGLSKPGGWDLRMIRTEWRETGRQEDMTKTLGSIATARSWQLKSGGQRGLWLWREDIGTKDRSFGDHYLLGGGRIHVEWPGRQGIGTEKTRRESDSSCRQTSNSRCQIKCTYLVEKMKVKSIKLSWIENTKMEGEKREIDSWLVLQGTRDHSQ